MNQKLNGRRILIVEDSSLVALDLRRMVMEEGGTVIGPALSIDQAHEMLQGNRVEVALLDINLDGTMVFPIARELKSQGISFVFLTGYNPEMILPPDLTDSQCLEKPVSKSALMSLLLGL